ncbi:MAG: adenylate/guanylate cyclase domain-containing protein [Polyangiaceae bacterium]|nr:adenylate/guanylate cyclase domain-containing protein [Polyangiaceae bacterium]
MERLDTKRLLELHPWPAEWAHAERIERLWVYDLPGAPEDFWPFISDTSRMNRALGTAEMTFSEREGKRFGRSRPGGVEHAWIELPWNWVANQWITCHRIYERGFFRAVWAIHKLEPIPSGTRLYLYYGAVPRNMLSAVAIRIGFPTVERAYSRVLPQLAAELDQYRPAVLTIPPTPLAESAIQRLKTQRAALIEKGLPSACVNALIDWIQNGDDQDLYRIQIRERARVWKLPERDLIRVALHATRAGLLTLSWDTVCPHCRGVRDENAALAELSSNSHCEVCQIDFGTDTEESVEVTFHVHPSIRDVPEQLYCSAEPAKKSHIRVQRLVPPGGREKVAPKLEPGRYRARESGGNWFYLDIDDEGETLVRWSDEPTGTVIKAQRAATIELFNDGNDERMFTVEQATWSDHALRAGQLFGFHDFRDLFSEEYIGADVRLGIGEQTILFTDVVGSTAFYAKRGDPAAFVEIKRHFDEVFAIVATYRGAVVKTIGDAVMATFGDPLDAVRASEKIHDTFPPGRADTPIRLRISLNTGSCIAVKLNANADFFGGTVNIAAKLQALAETCQVAMSEVTYQSPGVAAYLAERGVELETVTLTTKGFAEPIAARRWTVHRVE